MDMSYYPANAPILKIQDKLTEPILARVIYSRPQKNGRKVFGELIEMGNIWRLGANEATELELFRDAKIGGRKIKKGRYTLYAIPRETSWTFIVNKDTDTWGAFKYDQAKDVARVDVRTEKIPEPCENFTIYFERSSGVVNMLIFWDDYKAIVPFVF